MKNPLTFGRTVLLSLALLASTQALASHPGLFYDASQVNALRSKAQTTHQAIYQPILNGTAYFLGSTIAPSSLVTWKATGATFNLGDSRDIGNSLVVYAFVSQISTDPRYFTLAHDWLMAVTSWGNLDLDATHDLVQGHLLAGLSVAYDMLAPRLTATEAAQVRATILLNANAMMTAAHTGIWWSDEYVQNHNWVNVDAIGFAALATQGELPAATTQAWLNYAIDNARKVKSLMDQISDGTWHEGFGYATYGLSWHLPFVSALERVTGVDVGDIGMVKAFPNALAHAQLPERPSQYILANGDFFGFNKDMGLLPLRYAAHRYGDGVAQAAADVWVNGESANTYAPELNQRVFEFFFYDPSVASVDLHTQPLDWYGSDLQAAVFRSSWDKGALVFALKNGPFGGVSGWNWAKNRAAPTGTLNFGHNHADDNGFYLYGNGSWLGPEAEGYFIGHPNSPPPAANDTVFHNSLTIDGAGQIGEGVRYSGDGASSYGWFFERKGGIPFFGSSDHFSYATGDGASLYPASLGLSRWDRHVLFLDRKWVVMRDVVQATASHLYGWTCHFMNGAAQEGSWIHGRGDNGQALGVAVVAPAAFKASVVAQQPVRVNAFNPNGAVYATSVTPTAASTSTTFLTALVPISESAWSSRPTVTPIDPNIPEGGLRFRDGSSTVSLAVFNDIPSQTRKVGSFTLVGLAAVAKYESGTPVRALLVQGTSFTDALHTLISQATPVQMLEADGLTSSVLSLTGDSTGHPRLYAPKATQVLWNKVSVGFRREGDYVVMTGTPAAPGTSSLGPSTSPGPQPPGTGGGVVGSGGDSSGSGTPGGPGSSVLTPGTSRPAIHALSCTTYGRQLTAFWIGAVLAAALGLFRRRRPLISFPPNPEDG